jgi:hypothetical protein
VGTQPGSLGQAALGVGEGRVVLAVGGVAAVGPDEDAQGCVSFVWRTFATVGEHDELGRVVRGADAHGGQHRPMRRIDLHLDAIHFATPTDGHYTPTVGASIDPVTGTIDVDSRARALHAGQNRGPMLAIGYWCVEGCRGRIELREHKGHLFATPHAPTGEQPDEQPRL